jgi:hypothetical protein
LCFNFTNSSLRDAEVQAGAEVATAACKGTLADSAKPPQMQHVMLDTFVTTLLFVAEGSAVALLLPRLCHGSSSGC